MKFISIYQKRTKDFVETEERILHLLKQYKHIGNYNYECADFNWANYINTYGIESTQKVIDEYCRKFKNPEKAIFICQHISVNKLNWRSKNIFTPHCYNNNFKSIPHLAINSGKYKYFNDRKYDISFAGSYETHITRPIACNSVKNNFAKEKIYLKNTGGWHFYDRKLEREVEYKSLLSNTKIALCPRGTGPSTIRLWEAIATGCIPLIIVNNNIMPLNKLIKWNKFVVAIPVWQASLAGNICKEILKKEKSNLETKSKELTEIFFKYFSKDNIHMSIIKEIEN